WPDAFTRGTITAPAGSTVTNGADGNDFTVSLGPPLAPGASATITVQYTVAASVAAGDYNNSAKVHSPTDPTDSTARDTHSRASSLHTGGTSGTPTLPQRPGATTVTAGDGVLLPYTTTATTEGSTVSLRDALPVSWPDAFTRGTITAPAGSTVTNGADGNDF